MLTRTADAFIYRFTAMACPCEVIVDADQPAIAAKLGAIVEGEARRIEQKFSRYRPDSVVGDINARAGEACVLDNETADLIDFAAVCHTLSGGLFDITSGALRRVWRFDGSDNVPTPDQVEDALRFVGWGKVEWRRPDLRLLAGMEIDLGGIGKEYAVDCALRKAAAFSDAPTLVNFGGDLGVTRPRRAGLSWRAAIESATSPGASDGLLVFSKGALATSGDARRFLHKDGVRYSHILDPRSGWPVQNPPRSVTVAAQSCTEAGMLSTLAMLRGAEAETFLKAQGAQAWIAR